jgi:hypothetical protein
MEPVLLTQGLVQKPVFSVPDRDKLHPTDRLPDEFRLDIAGKRQELAEESPPSPFPIGVRP